MFSNNTPPPPPPSFPPLPPPPRYHLSSTPVRHHRPPYYTPSPTLFMPKTPSQTESSPVIVIHRTHPLVWCGAFACLVFSLVLILFGISTIIVFAALKPRYPTFDVPAANLTALYVDSPGYLNGDISFLANFTYPNDRLDVEFRSVDLQVYFNGRVIAEGAAVEGFRLRRRGGMKVGVVRMISSLVYLPMEVAMELQRKVASNSVEYEVRGRFWMKAEAAGGFRVSYWLRSRCLLQMTAPPGGVLVARSCSTRR